MVLIAGVGVSMGGCEPQVKTERKTEISGPGGTTTTTDTHKVESTGQNPPPNAQGETGK
jgi:hypothetical protein